MNLSLKVGYLIVEHDNCPELLQDKYWDECIPKEIPYTVGAEKYKKENSFFLALPTYPHYNNLIRVENIN